VRPVFNVFCEWRTQKPYKQNREPQNFLETRESLASRYVPRSKYLAALAVLALALSLLELTDLVELPYESLMGIGGSSSIISLTSLEASISTYGYLGLFALMVLESASLPVPSEVVLPFAGYLVYTGAMNFWVALADSTVAGLVGALTIYYLAFRLGRGFIDRTLERFGVSARSIDGAERWVSTKGAWGVLIARFLPGLRSIISIPAGIFNMKLKPFFITTLVGSFVWSAFLIYLGYSAGQLWNYALNGSAGWVGTAVLAAVAAAAALYVGYYAWTARSKSRL
jgi:membrane protein DedA with SNARE-associated domain